MKALKKIVKKLAKQALYTLQGVPKELDARTLPWIDRADPDIQGFLRTFPKAKDVPYDLADKLRFWQKHGYVVLEGIISTEWLDQLTREVDQFLEHPESSETTVIVSSKPGNQKAKN